MFHAVKPNVRGNPPAVGLLCPVSQVLTADEAAELVHKLYWLLGYRAGDIIHSGTYWSVYMYSL